MCGNRKLGINFEAKNLDLFHSDFFARIFADWTFSRVPNDP